MTTIIGKKYNLNFVLGFDCSDIIVNLSTYTYAKWMILYSFERWKRALILESKIMQIESLDEEIFTFKCKSLFQIDSKCVERIYYGTNDSINANFSSLDRSHSPLSSKYEFIFLAYIYIELFMILQQAL